MIKDKSEFYDVLWDDYINLHEDDKENCFVFTYLKRKKDNRAEIIGRSREVLAEYLQHKRFDKYTLLKSAYISVTKHKIMTIGEYSEVLKRAAGSKLSQKYEAISTPEEMDKAEAVYERQFLMGCVNDFFYNLGYRTNKNSEHGQSVKIERKNIKEDGYTDEFEMLYEYNKYSGKTEQPDFAVSPAEISAEYIEKCDKLFETMIKEKRKDAFVPLYVDSNTSAGIYIIGVNRFGESTFAHTCRRTDDVCYICIINFLEFDGISRIENLPEDDMSMNMWIMERHLSARKAFTSFEKYVSGQDFYKNYPDENNNKLPEGVDDAFNLYFMTKEQNQEYMRKKMKDMIVEAVLREEEKIIGKHSERKKYTKK